MKWTFTRLTASAGFVVALLTPAIRADAGTCTWTGGAGAGNNTWSVATNWTGATCASRPPQNGDSLVFPAGVTVLSTQNNLANLSIVDITITGSGYHLTGNGLTLTHIALFNATNLTGTVDAEIELPLTLGADVTILNSDGLNSRAFFTVHDIALNGHTLSPDTPTSEGLLVLNGAITGNGAIIKVGTGALSREGGGDYTGSTLIFEGEVELRNSAGFGATGPGNETTIADGATLRLPSDNLVVGESLTIQGTGNGNDGAIFAIGKVPTLTGPITLAQSATIRLATTVFTVTGAIVGPTTTLTIDAPSSGTMILSNPANSWSSLVVKAGTLQVGAAGALPDTARLTLLSSGSTLDLHDHDETIGTLESPSLPPAPTPIVKLGSGTLTINQNGATDAIFAGQIVGTGGITKTGTGNQLLLGTTANTYTGTTTVAAGHLVLGKIGGIDIPGPTIVNGGTLIASGDDQFSAGQPMTIISPGVVEVLGTHQFIGALAGNGSLNLHNAFVQIRQDTATEFSGVIGGTQTTAKLALGISGNAPLTLSGTNIFTGRIDLQGALIVNGSLHPATTTSLKGGYLGGTGSVGTIVDGSGLIAPGKLSQPGLLHALALNAAAYQLDIALNGPTAGTGYDQLDLASDLTLPNLATLEVTRGFGPRKGTTFTIVTLPAGKKVTGVFMDLPEGASLEADGQHFRITYTGGDGNDIVLTALDNPPPISYFLSEGATGGFFDEDVLLANPNDVAAPVTLTFSKENGEQVVTTKSLPPQSRLTVHVDQIPGVEATAASTTVRSDDGLPLFVERSMFWDTSYYAGHTGSAVEQPATEWLFAEGSQGFFQTFVLVINPNATPADVTFTFFRESEPPVVKTMQIGANTRLTLDAGSIPEIVDRSFGIKVAATQPIMAERSMYFGTTPARLWSGGTESAGVTFPATRWFFAEGATGGFFDTFILLSNPQTTPAQVTLQYLLDTGETLSVKKTIPANTRLTTNIAVEEDPRLHNAAVSTVVSADVPIIAERSMYWKGAASPWGEGHNSFGVVRDGLRWGLAEGRVGGPLNFHTYILLANPQSTAAAVTITFLREGRDPLVQTYSVPPTSRFNIDTNTIAGLENSSFGAQIDVTNGVPIIVERSMYWDSNGFFFSGGTNATGISLRP